jgi:hypothetical protein
MPWKHASFATEWKTSNFTEKNLTTVAQALVQSPKKSIWKTPAEFVIPPTSVYRIVNAMKLKVYRPHLL